MAPDASAPPVLSVVVPLYNEEETVGELLRRLLQTCRTLKEPFELVTVDDGSRDRTLDRLLELSRRNPELRVIRLSRNFGHMAALDAGIVSARGAAVVTLDGDLQDPPELIPRLFEKWREGADVVYALRTTREESGLQKTGTSLFYWLLDHLSETPIPKQVGTFGLMDRRVAEILRQLPERQRFFAGLRAWAGGKQDFIPYERPPRPYGKSKVGTAGLFRLARMALVSFSKTPLRWASFLSLGFSLFLFAVGLTAILIRLFTSLAIPGWATFTALLGLIGSIQSLVLALLSEYVAVLFDEIKGRPLYVIQAEYAAGRPVDGPMRTS